MAISKHLVLSLNSLSVSFSFVKSVSFSSIPISVLNRLASMSKCRHMDRADGSRLQGSITGKNTFHKLFVMLHNYKNITWIGDFIFAR